eukprot:jgi/Mesvir1/24879/Mv22109-RA.1
MPSDQETPIAAKSCRRPCVRIQYRTKTISLLESPPSMAETRGGSSASKTQAEYWKAQAMRNSRELQATKTEVAELQRQLRGSEQTLEQQLKRNDEVSEALVSVTEKLQHWEAKLADVEQQLHHSHASAGELEMEVQRGQARARELEQQLQCSQARAGYLEQQLQRSQARAGDLEQQVQDLQARADAAETALAEKEKALAEKEKISAEKEVALAELRAQRSDQHACRGCAGELERRQGRAAAAQAEHTAAGRQIPSGEGGHQLAGRRGQVAQGQRTVEDLQAEVEGLLQENAKRCAAKANNTHAWWDGQHMGICQPPPNTVPEAPSINAEVEGTVAGRGTGKAGASVGSYLRAPLDTLWSLLPGRRAADQELLLRCITTQDLGFHDRRPVAACLLFLSMLHWRSFEDERTDIFNKLLVATRSAVEARVDDISVLAYWLCNMLTLHNLMEQTLHRRATDIKPPPRILVSSSNSSARHSGARTGCTSLGTRLELIEACAQTSCFMFDVWTMVEKLFMLIADIMTKSVIPLLLLCIRAPAENQDGGNAVGAAVGTGTPAGLYSTVLDASVVPPWHQLTDKLTQQLQALQANCLPVFLVQRLFTRLATFLNVQLFNCLLANRECCSLSNGEYMEAGLERLESWTRDAAPDYVGNCWEELKHVRQAVTFLASKHKAKLSRWTDISCKLCPALTSQQLHGIATNYWDDKDGTETLSKEVLEAPAKLSMWSEDDDIDRVFFQDHRLLDHFSNLALVDAELRLCMPAIGLDGIPLPASLRESPSFRFLLGPAR